MICLYMNIMEKIEKEFLCINMMLQHPIFLITSLLFMRKTGFCTVLNEDRFWDLLMLLDVAAGKAPMHGHERNITWIYQSQMNPKRSATACLFREPRFFRHVIHMIPKHIRMTFSQHHYQVTFQWRQIWWVFKLYFFNYIFNMPDFLTNTGI